MGMTIHFKGQLSGDSAYKQLIAEAYHFSEAHHCVMTAINEEAKELLRVTDDERHWNHVSDVKGVRLDLHPDSEPLFLEFDEDLYIQDWVKTQFAGADLHALLVGFLRRVQPLFLNLDVLDETEFWETEDFELLQQSLAHCQFAIEEQVQLHPGCRYKVHQADGRIVDLIT